MKTFHHSIIPSFLFKFVLSLFFALIPYENFAQRNQDLWQWTTFSLDKKINIRFYFTFDEELRFDDNVSKVNLYYTNVGFGYRINRFLKISLVYRLIEKNTNDGYSTRHRFYTDLIFKHKINRFTLGYRSRVQTQVRDVYSSEDGTSLESYWRHKFDFKYTTTKKFVPYLAAEFRYQFPDNPRMREANGKFDRGRYYLGCDYEINKKNTVGLYYMIQKEFNVNEAETDFVIGVQYAVSL